MTISDKAHSLKQTFLHNDRIILILFAVYGLVGGSTLYISSLTSERIEVLHPASVMNFPAILLLIFIRIYLHGGAFVDLMSSYPVLAIPTITFLWTFIGLAVYGLVRMLRLDSTGPALKS